MPSRIEYEKRGEWECGEFLHLFHVTRPPLSTPRVMQVFSNNALFTFTQHPTPFAYLESNDAVYKYLLGCPKILMGEGQAFCTGRYSSEQPSLHMPCNVHESAPPTHAGAVYIFWSVLRLLHRTKAFRTNTRPQTAKKKGCSSSERPERF